MPSPADLASLRERIEALDRELIDVLERRLQLAVPIAEAKLQVASPLRDQQREGVVFQRVVAMATERGLDPNRVDELYRLLLQWSVARQQSHLNERSSQPLRVAYQGVEGSYTHLAAQQRYANREGGTWLVGQPTFRAAVQAVLGGACHLALLPIENTTAGSITETYDLLGEGGVTITGEVVLHVDHCLLALPDTSLDAVREVRSHPQALRQCERFLLDHPWIRPVESFDTAGAAKAVRERGAVEVAAIASAEAGTRYGLHVLASGIQSQSGNYTRFVEVSTEAVTVPAEAACTTSAMFDLAHEPGALAKVVTAFSDHGVDLTKLQSRPILEQPWRYRFYVDLVGHASSQAVSDALATARQACDDLRVLGSYPAAERPT
ncbi:MAG: prephenate dehydratase [Myxococcales bacterium]|nr:prephenate dehydratase [Myxococcales bacterium]